MSNARLLVKKIELRSFKQLAIEQLGLSDDYAGIKLTKSSKYTPKEQREFDTV